AEARSLLIREGGVERRLRPLPQQRPHVRDSLGCAVQAVHPGILPLDRDGAGVADRPQRTEGVLPGDVSVAGGYEVPAAPRVPPWQMRAEDAAATARRTQPGVLAVDVVDPVSEVDDEPDGVDALPEHVARVPVQAE